MVSVFYAPLILGPGFLYLTPMAQWKCCWFKPHPFAHNKAALPTKMGYCCEINIFLVCYYSEDVLQRKSKSCIIFLGAVQNSTKLFVRQLFVFRKSCKIHWDIFVLMWQPCCTWLTSKLNPLYGQSMRLSLIFIQRDELFCYKTWLILTVMEKGLS